MEVLDVAFSGHGPLQSWLLGRQLSHKPSPTGRRAERQPGNKRLKWLQKNGITTTAPTRQRPKDNRAGVGGTSSPPSPRSPLNPHSPLGPGSAQEQLARFADGVDVVAKARRQFYPSTYRPPCAMREWVLTWLAADGRFGPHFAQRLWEDVTVAVETSGSAVFETHPKLTEDEFRALFIYTYFSEGAPVQLFKELNRAMRQGTDAEVARFLPLVWYIDNALQHLSPHVGYVFRGVNSRIDKTLYSLGQEVCWTQFSSTSMDKRVAQEFLSGGDQGGTLFIVYSLSSCPVAAISHLPHQQECLFPANTLFKVTTVVPESHLQILGTNADIVALRQVPAKNSTAAEPLDAKLEASRILHFIYDNFLATYVHPNGRLQPNAVEVFDLQLRVTEFLETPVKNLLIVGPSGSGKTSFMLFVARGLLDTAFHPFFISLPAVDNIFTPNALLTHLRQQYDFTEAHLQELRQKPVVFVLDSFDEISSQQQRSGRRNLNVLNGLHGWPRAKVIISCRDDFVAREASTAAAAAKLFGDGDATRAQADQLSTLHIAPFTNSQILSYMEKMHAKQAGQAGPDAAEADPTDIWGQIQGIPGLVQLIRSPFVLSMALDALPMLVSARGTEGRHCISRFEVYQASMTQHFTKRLARDPARSGRLAEDLRHCFTLAAHVAMWMYRQGRVQAVIREYHGSGPAAELAKCSQADRDFFFTCLPLRVGSYAESQTFSFRHKSLLEFFVACALWARLEALEEVSIAADPAVVGFLADMYRQLPDPKALCERLVALVVRSRSAASAAVRFAAANAATLLNAAGHSFAGYDLHGVSIPGADLSNAILQHTNLQRADLRGCTLKGAVLDFANLQNANLLDVHVGLQPIMQQGGPVTGVSVFSRGRLIASCGESHDVFVWNFDGQLVRTLSGHTRPLQGVAFAPNGRLLASVSRDKTCRLWTEEGECAHVLRGHKGFVNCVAFAPHGGRLATGGDDQMVMVWSSAGRRLLTLFGHLNAVRCVAFSPNDAHIVSGSADNTVKVWSTRGTLEETLSMHTASVRCVAVSLDGQTITSGGRDKSIRLSTMPGRWTGPSSLIKCLMEDTDTVNSIAFSPDGKTFATGCTDKTVRLWSSEGNGIGTLDGHTGYVTAVDFSADGKLVVSGSQDGTVRIWSVGQEEAKTPDGHSNYISAVAVSEDGAHILTGGYDRTIKMWNRNAEHIWTIDAAHNDLVKALDILSDGCSASGSLDKTLKLWSADGVLVRQLDLKSPVNSVAISPEPDRCWILVGLFDKTVRLLGRDFSVQHTFEGHTQSVRVVCWDASGTQFASSGKDGTVRIWRKSDEDFEFHCVHCIEAAHAGINALAFSPDGHMVAAGGVDNMVRLFSVEGSYVRPLRALPGHICFVNCLVFTADGRQVISGGGDGIRVWSSEAEELQVLYGHTKYVYGVAVTKDGNTLLSVSADKTIRVWRRNENDAFAAGRGKKGRFRLAAVITAATAFSCRGVRADGAKVAPAVRRLLDQLCSVQVSERKDWD
eukprot:EG_transcript_309